MRRSLLQRAAVFAGVATLALSASVLIPATPASAAPAVVLPVIPVDGGIDSNTQITQGPDGNMWAALTNLAPNNNDLVKLTPAGVPTYYNIPVVTGLAGIALGPDGNLWATTTNGVVKIPVANPAAGAFTVVPDFSEPHGITNGGDGFLYAGSGSRVFKISPASPATATSLDIPASGSLLAMSARGVTTGTDGRIWIADGTGSVVAVEKSLSPTYFRYDTGGMVQGIGAGPNGQVLYTNPGLNPQNVGRISYGGTAATSPTPAADPGFSVVFAPDGAYWMASFNNFNVIRVTPAGALSTVGTFPGATQHPRNIAVGPGGTLWVGLDAGGGNAGAIGRISGVVAPPVAPPDTSASIDVKSKTVTVSRGGKTAGKGSVKLVCPAAETAGPCTGKLTIKAAGKPRTTLAKKTFSIAAGTTGKVKIRIKNSGIRRAMQSNGKLKTVLTVVVADTLGNTTTVKQKLTIKLHRLPA